MPEGLSAEEEVSFQAGWRAGYRDGRKELKEALKWLAQTVHQAHHEGKIEECPKNTCDHAMRVLGRKK